MGGGVSCGRRCVLVGGGVSLWEEVCPCGRRCVPVGGGVSLLEEACSSLRRYIARDQL